MKQFTLLFVCTGNLCRSPMAEGIMKDLLLDEASTRRVMLPIVAASAGIHAEDKRPASRHAVEVAKEHGINLSFHRSRLLTADIARNVSLILTMERRQTEFIKINWPDVLNVHELKQYGFPPGEEPADLDVADPIGHGIEVYRHAFGELKEEVVRVSRILFPAVAARFSSI